MAINAGRSDITLPFLGFMDVGIIYPLVLIPLGIVGATTTYNFLAGFNGLEAGQGILLITAMSLVAYLTGTSWLAIVGLCMVASLAAFLFYNRHPAKVFPGDALTYTVGGLIAIMSILGNFEKVAVFFFIPYILETGLKLRGGLKKESFGNPQKDGTLSLKYPNLYGLTHVALFLLPKLGARPTEKNAVHLILAFQLLIILAGFLIFREGIFLI
jgi:UDP-N-acetylglucosamine--dolichyl-phosphate N-acetylglucosaminephosphotransferase